MTEDIEAVLAVCNRDVDELLHTVRAEADTLFTWDYEKGARPGLDKLYEKAKSSQWNGATDLDWSIDVDAHYPTNAHLRMLLDASPAASRWDMTYLGMPIMVEGFPLAGSGCMHTTTTEPLLKRLLRYNMSDEARHVAFGVLSLQELYGQL